MNFLPETIVKTVSRNSLLVQKASPELLLAAGVVGAVGSTVLACRATLKMDALLTEAQTKLNQAKTLQHDDYSETDRSRDVTLIKFQSSVQIVKLYAPAALLGIASISALIASNRILNSRNVALTAAYAALDRGFREYRARVVDKFGADQDRDFRYGTEKVEIVNPETNRKKTVTRVGPGEPSIYAKFFDASSKSWNKEPEYNYMFLRSQQNSFNDQLKARGHVFLNEVYRELGLPHTKPGSVVGWIYDPSDPMKDNFIDFGLWDERQEVRDFVNGYEGSILLDFNVDGVIYDKLEH